MTLRLEPVAGRRAARIFRDVPARLHASAPCFVPALDAAFDVMLDRRRNPFWKHAAGQEWIAWRGSRPVGRIAACRDEALLQRAMGTGAVGFFECADDAEASAALFEEAFTWLRARGLDRARGPLNPSIHDTAGLLVEGFDTPPVFDTTWNPPYYGSLWEAGGWKGVQDLLGCGGILDAAGPERMHRFAELALQGGVSVRPLDMSRFAAEVEQIRQVYNAAWDQNWGHIPIDAEEFAFKAKDMKSILDPDIVRIAEKEGRVVAFLLALPDFNVPIRRSRGRLLPFGWWRILRARRRSRRARVIAMGVVKGARLRGIEALMLSDGFRAVQGRYEWCEASWILDHNAVLLNGLGMYGLKPYKRWRIYEREL